MANNPNDWETYHEVPASKYWYLGDYLGAVPIRFFKFWTCLCITASVSITATILLTDWWQQLLQFLFLGKGWFLGWLGTPLLIIILYFARKRKHPPKRQK